MTKVGDITLRALQMAWIEPHKNGSVIVLPRLDGLYEELAALCGWEIHTPAGMDMDQYVMPSQAVN